MPKNTMDRVLRSALNAAQRGLPQRPLFGHISTTFLKKHDLATRDKLLDLIQKLDQETLKNYPESAFIIGFSPALWGKWNERDIPINNQVLKHGLHLQDTGGDFLIYIKSPDKETANKIVSTFIRDLIDLAEDIHQLELGKRPDGRVMGGRYVDHITNPNDPISLAEDILVDSDGPDNGSSFCITQKFKFDWPDVTSQPGEALNSVIGRRPDGEIVSQQKYLTENAHVNRAHVLDANLDQRKLLRQALPFDDSNKHASREDGIMFVAFCNEQNRFEKILQNMLGDSPERPLDRLMDFVIGEGGTYWYIPSAGELGVTGVTPGDDTYEDTHWQVRSKNGYLYYNHPDYMHQMSEGYYVAGDQPSVRVLSLLSRTFNHWRDGWMKNESFPRLPHLKDLHHITNTDKIPESILERKGLANYATLADILSSPKSKTAQLTGLVRITPKELVVGALPDFTLGRGKEVVTYLDDDEIMAAWLKCSLDEGGAMGHIVPNFQTLVNYGVGALIANLDVLAKEAPAGSEKASFYISARDSFKGVQVYLQNWAGIASTAAKSAKSPEDQANMEEVRDRLTRLATQPPETYHDAVQLIFSAHCCLHLVGELTAFGRLDQILWPLLEADLEKNRTTLGRAQEVMDCLWIKIGEHAFVNRAFIYDYRGYGTGSVNGFGANFHQGGGINQWVQQVTVGGYKPDDEEVPEGGANPVTLLCLRSARRIPVNAPSLSLRTYSGIPQEYIDEAATAILSGGAQPTLFNDDKLCEGLYRAGRNGKVVSRGWSRDYAADGCYEPMLTGATEFSLANVELLGALEQTLNQGSTYGAAGSVHLRGLKQTFRSPPVEEITTFAQLQDIFLKQLHWVIVRTYNLFLTGYGNWEGICPSPLLSGLIDGCVESGLDLTAGGAKFHMLGPMCIGAANVIDSLYAIKKLCYDPESARVTLPELVNCLICDWGYNMIEPYQDASLGPANAAANAVRYQELRQVALALPKWAGGNDDDEQQQKRNPEINELGEWVVDNMTRMCVDTLDNPPAALKPKLDAIYAKYGPGFEFIVTPGVGTFEGYVGSGIIFGASADGRRNGMPLASDMSPVPGPQDLPAAPARRDIYAAMESYKNEAVEVGVSNAAPVDMNIPEDFPPDRLKQFIRDFAEGDVGGNMLTLTCADLETYQRASEDPEKYNLLRVRMGGWSEFYPTMFPEYQEQQQRRQVFH